MSRRLALLALLFLLSWLLPPPLARAGDGESIAALPPPGFIHVQNRSFVTADGQPFLPKGIGFGNWLMQEGYMFKFKHALSPRQIDAGIVRILGRDGADAFWRRFHDNYISEADIRFLAAAGFNMVRIPLHYGLFVQPGNPPRFEGPGYRLLDNVIAWSGAAGLHVLLDLHAGPGGQTGVNHDDGTGYPLMLYLPSYRALTVALWRKLAERYRDDPTVIGYELLNEPISPYHDVYYLNDRLEPLYRDISAAIREVDPHHVIFLAAPQWSGNFSALGPPFLSNVAYIYHKFWSSTHIDAIQEYLNYGSRYNVPIFLGETGELTDEWNSAFRQLNEQHNIGWSFWTYKNMDTPTTVVSVPQPEGWDDVVAIADGLAEKEDGTKPSREKAAAALDAYLDAIKIENAHINWSYVSSLGLGPTHGFGPATGVAGGSGAINGPSLAPAQ
jgi:endoglucanase